MPSDPDGRPDVAQLLEELGRRRWTNLLLEGGAAVLGAFFDCGAVDEAHVFVAPKLIGGAAAKSPVAGVGRPTIAQGDGWITETMENIDGDAYLRCIRQIT